MAEEIVLRKSLMLAPICDGDQVAAAILDYLYLYFQSPSPLALYVESLQERYSEEMPDDFFEYVIRADEAPDESVPGYRQNFITCWLNQDAVLEAIYTYYCKHLAPPPPRIEGIDVRRERRVVTHHVHRAPGGAGGNADVRGVGRELTYFSLRCAFCQTAPYAVLEHVIPVILGGSSNCYNCVPACERCNAAKQDRLPSEVPELDQTRLQEIQQYLEQRHDRNLQR